MKLQKYDQFINDKINEELGYKDVLTGIALLAGIVGGTINKAEAQNRLKDKNVIDNIENVLNDPSKLDGVIDSLEAQGMKDAAKTVKYNADKVKSELKKLGTESITIGSKDFSTLKKHLEKGFAISKINLKEVVDEIVKMPVDKEFAADSTKLEFNSDQLFGIGLFKLNEGFSQELKSTIDSITSDGSIIVKINIESSTDKQRIGGASERLLASGYEATNMGLSKARNNAVASVVKGLLGDVTIDQTILAEQGEGEVGAVDEQDPSARYVKIEIISVVYSEKPDETTPKNYIKNVVYSFEVSKTKTSTSKSGGNGPNVKSYKSKVKFNSKSCPKFIGKK